MYTATNPKRAALRGLTLLETLVAMTLLSVSIVGLTSAISQNARLATSSIRSEEALGIARNRLALSVAEAEALPVPTRGTEQGYGWELSYEDRPHRLVLATVVVTWLDRGVERSLTLAEVYVPRSVFDGESQS